MSPFDCLQAEEAPHSSYHDDTGLCTSSVLRDRSYSSCSLDSMEDSSFDVSEEIAQLLQIVPGKSSRAQSRLCASSHDGAQLPPPAKYSRGSRMTRGLRR